MKTKNLFLAALATLALLPSLAQAQQKGATLLMPSPRVVNVQPAATHATAMSCPKCKEGYTAITAPSVKGRAGQTQLVEKDQCPACATTLKSVGMGKHATTQLVHTCNACGSTDASCCSTSKTGGVTAGM